MSFGIIGYVAVKLLKKYTKRNVNDTLNYEWQYSVRVLKKLKCEHVPACNDTVAKAWSEHIDKGGLYHVKPEVYHSIFIILTRCVY